MDEEGRALGEAEEKRIALSLLLDAWAAALARGVSPEAIATTAIFAALSDMIDLHGQEEVARLCDALPARVRKGEFTLAPSKLDMQPTVENEVGEDDEPKGTDEEA
ncbi:MAG: hypothetical protein HXY22_11730 [Alphaproteobacteria bacterium]|nr:hypothetical protein [Alphaproteobacteria bacterium]